MRCNRQELMALASQTSQNFDREGVLLLKERQDGFFRRTEGSALRWFRLRGNLLFYLKGPESWTEPMGFIMLGHHKITVQPQDENGYWPFQISWENGVVYRLATFHESERTLWIKAMELAPYEQIMAELDALQDRLNRIRPVIDITTYRQQKGIVTDMNDLVTDMNEIPICELALSCDNLLCDAHGSPPSPKIVVYVKFHRGLCVRYASTEIAESCSNPSFSKTVLFRGSDGLTGDELVRLVAYDVKEPVSETTVPIGFTALQLSTIQEAQRLRVALVTRENKTAGFVTMNGWSLEPSYIGTSPNHNSNCDNRVSIDVPQKILCHRRSQSLPPRLGLKLKFPSYGSLIKLNFVNSHQVTYRFHSGLGGDITVHEIMAEPKVCYQIPIQLLDIYIRRERELLEELLAVGEICGQWADRQLELVTMHISLVKHYGHSKKRLQDVDTPCFKPSSKKDEASLEFAPINLHLQRMWVHNDTLSKTGFHDVITAGAFTAHTHRAERAGGLIKLVQQLKDVSNSKSALMAAAANKIQSDYDNLVAMRRIRDDIALDLERMLAMLPSKQGAEIVRLIEEIKIRLRSFTALWDPNVVEDALSYITFPKNDPDQTITAVLQYTERLSVYDAASDSEFTTSSSASSNQPSPTLDFVPQNNLSSSVPNIAPNVTNQAKVTEGSELEFHNDYFKTDRNLNSSFRSVKSAKLTDDVQSLSLESTKAKSSSLKHIFKSSNSLEQVSYRYLIESGCGGRQGYVQGPLEKSSVAQLDAQTRANNLAYLRTVSDGLEETFEAVYEAVMLALDSKASDMSDQIDDVRTLMENSKAAMAVTLRWIRIAHAALRLRTEPLTWTLESAALQTRRDACFSQALTTVAAGLVCWLCSVPSEVVVKLLSSGLGPLCGFEGLLSLFATEKAMWGDMVVAIEDLQTVQFKLVKFGHSNAASLPTVTGIRGALVVHLPVSESLYSKLLCREFTMFTITAVFFNVGINEKSSMAETLGDNLPQYHSNNDNMDRLNKYYHKYTKILHDHMAENRAASSSRAKPLEEVMENLRIAVHKKKNKNVEVLQLAALATRLMNGIRFTSCKSAKDRTGMSVTLEQCSILTTEYHLAEHEQKKALDIMRSEGCRRENTVKNIGVRKYAFTKKQVMALPEDYRPPAGTYGATQT